MVIIHSLVVNWLVVVGGGGLRMKIGQASKEIASSNHGFFRAFAVSFGGVLLACYLLMKEFHAAFGQSIFLILFEGLSYLPGATGFIPYSRCNANDTLFKTNMTLENLHFQ